jgi:hypothetical protein
MSKITFSYKNFLAPTPKSILRVVNAVQSCCVMALGMAIYHDHTTLLLIISTVSIACHFVNACAGMKNNIR